MRWAIVVVALLTLATSAQAQDRKVTAAQMVFLAGIAPEFCSGVKTDREALASYMAKAGIGRRDLLRRYTAQVNRAAIAFTASIKRDPDAACDLISNRLGENGPGLLEGRDY